MAGGRKSLLTEELIEEITKLIGEDGLSYKDAAAIAGISESVFFKWKQKGLEELKERRNLTDKENEALGPESMYFQFVKALKTADAYFKRLHLGNIKTASRKQWQASAWLLERKFRDEFGRNVYEGESDKQNLLVDELKKLTANYVDPNDNKLKVVK